MDGRPGNVNESLTTGAVTPGDGVRAQAWGGHCLFPPQRRENDPVYRRGDRAEAMAIMHRPAASTPQAQIASGSSAGPCGARLTA